MNNELNIAKEAAIEAGKIILSFYKSDYEIKSKGFNNPVTTADNAADRMLKETLLKATPDYGWLSEETEDSKDRLSKNRVWVVDPIDGTKEFIEGIPHFVVSVGLVENGKPILGVIYNPVSKEIFYASLNGGAYFNEYKISCLDEGNLSSMVILNSRSETNHGLWDPYKDLFKEVRAIGSIAYKLALTAAGKATVVASLRPKNEWDICAGNCIINEAGGKLVDLYGNERRYNLEKTLLTPGLIAGHKNTVDKTLEILKA